MTEEKIENIVNAKNIAERVAIAVKALDTGIEQLKEVEKPILNWNNFGIAVAKELVNNLWELKDSAQNFVDRNPQNKKVIDWLNVGWWKELVSAWNKNAAVPVETEIPNYNLLPSLNSSIGKLDKKDRK